VGSEKSSPPLASFDSIFERTASLSHRARSCQRIANHRIAESTDRRVDGSPSRWIAKSMDRSFAANRLRAQAPFAQRRLSGTHCSNP
jgi:hypothetical protein